MKYRQGTIGRIFVAKVEQGDDLIAELTGMAKNENIEAGIIYIIGGIKEGSVVVGPEEFALPPVPVWREFNDCREILGVGTLFRDGGEPLIHLHGAFGRGDSPLVGCLRGQSEIYMIAEAIIVEINGSGAVRKFDPQMGLKVLDFILPEKERDEEDICSRSC